MSLTICGSSAAGTTGSVRLFFSIDPNVSTISTEWCATIARPLSLTSVGCGTDSESQTSITV